MPLRQIRTEKLDLRLTPAAKRTLKAAAAEAGKSVSDFVIQSAMTEAAERLADRKAFPLDDAKWKAFHKALDAPTRRHDRLDRLFAEPSVFDRG